MIFLFILIFLVVIGVEIFLITLGVKQCKNNDVVGLIWMFLALNFLGLVIGYVLLSRAKEQQANASLHETYDESYEASRNSTEKPNEDEWVYDNNEDVWKRK